MYHEALEDQACGSIQRLMMRRARSFNLVFVFVDQVIEDSIGITDVQHTHAQILELFLVQLHNALAVVTKRRVLDHLGARSNKPNET